MDPDTLDDSRVPSTELNAFDDPRVSGVSLFQQSATQWSFQRPGLALVRSSLIDLLWLANAALHVNSLQDPFPETCEREIGRILQMGVSAGFASFLGLLTTLVIL